MNILEDNLIIIEYLNTLNTISYGVDWADRRLLVKHCYK